MLLHSEFEGPFIRLDLKGFNDLIQSMNDEEGRQPPYQRWLIEFGNEKGFLRGLGDNEGKFQLIEHEYPE